VHLVGFTIEVTDVSGKTLFSGLIEGNLVPGNEVRSLPQIKYC